MVLKKKNPGRAFSPARKALSRSGFGLCRSPRRGLSTSFQASSKPVPLARPGARPAGSNKGSSANMKVVVRVRPLNHRERESNARVIVDVVDEKMVVFDPKIEEDTFFFQGVKQKGRDMLKKQNKNAQFLYDRVFGTEATNEEVFEGSTKSIVNSVLDGFNCSVFVYGATGAGKTFTMLGTHDNPGITLRTMVDLYRQIEEQKHEKEFDIGVSYLEVYNETVKDLLCPTSGNLFLREDGVGVVVAGLKLERISNPDRMFELLEFGNRNRSQHATDANAESSRSHAVFQVFIKMKTKATGQTKMVKLSMIDLAGSERGAATGCAGMRFKEGSNINKSLLALGNCINALADGLRHIPFRDSKLTRLLKDSLGGNCQTVMIANVSPSHHTYEDTHNTLKYATRAKSIKFQIKRNIVSVELHVSHYIKMVEDLQTENERLKSEIVQLKKEREDEKVGNQSDTSADDKQCQQPPAQSHLPPVVAAAVAAISSKMKPTVSTSVVAVNTSPMKGLSNEFQRLLDEAGKLYSRKSQLHQRYLNMDSSDKRLRWRIKLKQRTFDRISSMSSTPSRTDQAQIKVGKSVDQFKGRLNSVMECQDEVSAEEEEINRCLLKIQEESRKLGIFDEVAPYLNNCELQFKNQELLMRCQNAEKLMEYVDCGFESDDEVLKKISTLFRKYYNLVRGHGHMTEELRKEHEIVMRGLEGIKSVQWRDEAFPEDDEGSAKLPSSSKSCSSDGISLSSNAPSIALTHLDWTPQLPLGLSEGTQNIRNTGLLQSPLCSSSSSPPTAPEATVNDTTSMLSTLEDLDSKVDSILNTSVCMETGCITKDAPDSEENGKTLNVTFNGESNLNSTFTKDDPVETVTPLNETFDKDDGTGDQLNGTFSLDDASNVNVPDSKLITLPQAVSSEVFGVKTLTSPSTVLNVSPALGLKKLSSPSAMSNNCPATKTNAASLSKSPIVLSVSNGLVSKGSSPSSLQVPGYSMKPQTSALSSSSAMTSTLLKKSSPSRSSPSAAASLLLAKKIGTGVPSPTFAVPFKPAPSLKRPVGSGVAEKKKAPGTTVLSKHPTIKLGSTRKVIGTNIKLNINTTTPSKVKLAWNKENRNVNGISTTQPMRPSTAIKAMKNVGSTSTKPVTKPSSAPVPLNDTFTKL